MARYFRNRKVTVETDGSVCRLRIASTVCRASTICARCQPASGFLSVEPLLLDVGALDLTNITRSLWVANPVLKLGQ